jgi:hypothetical protein
MQEYMNINVEMFIIYHIYIYIYIYIYICSIIQSYFLSEFLYNNKGVDLENLLLKVE